MFRRTGAAVRGHSLDSDLRTPSRISRITGNRLIRTNPFLKISIAEKAAENPSSPRVVTPFPTPGHHNASPEKASFEDLRRYQLHLVASGTGTPNVNHTATALRFLFIVTLRKPQIVSRLPFIREPPKLPIILSPEEVARLLDAAPASSTGGAECRLRRGM
jgi:hypothetical protein